MKKMRKNNKGFSLVELIVVVLIMAIIAIALAPQVMKWVNKSRISKDVSIYEQVYSNLQTCGTNESVWNAVKGINITVTVSKDAEPSFSENAPQSLKDEFASVSGSTKELKFKTVTSATITINNGVVTKGGSINEETGEFATTAPTTAPAPKPES